MESQALPSELMEALLKDPIKRALVLDLIKQEKHNIEKYKKEQNIKNTPTKRLKKLHCESPSALQRRRALEKVDSSESSSSELSDFFPQKNATVPFDKLLNGVTAYVEVKRENQDRSEGIKAVMQLMGATIKEKFTPDVTHVIFKDGSFITYERAKLLKVHLVSVLWLDAIRRHGVRVPEKNYPAFGSRVCDQNVSILCSQIEKDYKDVIKDERRRRHTLFSLKTSVLPESDVTSDDSDCGVINGHIFNKKKQSPQITDDASNDSTSLLNYTKNKRKTINILSDMVLTPNVPDNKNKTSSTMSSLRISSETDKTKSGLEVKDNSSMASLRLSDKKSNTFEEDKMVQEVLKKVTTPRQKQKRNSASDVDDSFLESISKSSQSESPKAARKSKRSSEKPSTSAESISDQISSKSSEETKTKRPVLAETNVSGRRKTRQSVLIAEKTSEENKKFSEESSVKGKRGRPKRSIALSNEKLKENQTPAEDFSAGDCFKDRKLRQSLFTSDSEQSSKASDESFIKPKRGRKSRRLSIVSNESSNDESLGKKEQTPPKESNFRTPQRTTRCSSVVPSKPNESIQARSMSVDRSLVKIPTLDKKCRTEIKKTRKLYNPDDLIALPTPEENKERENHFLQKTKPKHDGFVDPNEVNAIPPKKNTEKNELLLLLDKSLEGCSSYSDEKISPKTPTKRRSTLDFESLTPSQQRRRLMLSPKRPHSIVCTKMHRHQVENFERIVGKLGKFFVEEKVSSRTTHLVVGEAKRTVNMLKAIARGCWILRHEWLLNSEKANRWLNEEDYEVTDFAPAVQVCRLQKEAFGPLYSMDIFQTCGYIYVGKSTRPKPSDLKELITICKGKVTHTTRHANIAVGEYVDREGVTSVTETWVLDSVCVNKVKSFKKYLLTDNYCSEEEPSP